MISRLFGHLHLLALCISPLYISILLGVERRYIGTQSHFVQNAVTASDGPTAHGNVKDGSLGWFSNQVGMVLQPGWDGERFLWSESSCSGGLTPKNHLSSSLKKAIAVSKPWKIL